MNAINKVAASACQESAAGQFDSEDVPSPCTQVCRIDAHTGCCVGCLRRLEEIGGWSSMSNADKRAVWARIAERRAAQERA